MAIAISLTINNIPEEEDQNSTPALHRSRDDIDTSPKLLQFPSKRSSRFLAEQPNPRAAAADHCRKDNEVCYTGIRGSANSTCCNNKCVYLQTDNQNCGACKNKCKYTQSCCRGQCVYLFMDKRHCGRCNNRCVKEDECVLGMCSYGA